MKPAAMNPSFFKTSLRLSFILVVLSATASLGGLFIPGLYNDNPLIIAAWKGNDLVTAVLAIPLMIISMISIMKGSARGLLVWLGTLLYLFYNYLFYLYGAAFNEFFLLYVALTVISAFSLISTLIRIKAEDIAARFKPGKGYKWVAGFMVIFGSLLGLLWMGMSASYLFTHEVPAPIQQTGHPTGVVFATDLILLVPLLWMSGVLLWKSNNWGFVLAPVLLVKATTYGLALICMSGAAYLSTGGHDPFIGLWIVLTLGCIVSAGVVYLAIGKEGMS